MVGRVSRWLKPGAVPAGSALAHVDPVALVTPPEGLEHGYVTVMGDNVILRCHLLSLTVLPLDSTNHANLAVIAVIVYQNDSVVHG